MKIHAWLKDLHSLCRFMSIEVPGKVASNSELRRWIEQGSLIMNAERVMPDELLDFPLISVVLFPKSEKRKVTLL
jgi:hypothetical protein